MSWIIGKEGNMGGKIGQNENSLFCGGQYATCVAICPDFTGFRKWEFQIKFLSVFFVSTVGKHTPP